MGPPTSNIRAFVQWSQPTIFAGEEIECQITFKNITPANGAPKPSSQPPGQNGFAPGGERQRKTTPLQASAAQTRNNAGANLRATQASRGHRSSFSLNVPASELRLPLRSPGQNKAALSEAGTEGRSHRRSVSIISLGITESGADESASQHSFHEGLRRPVRGHVRASSLQIVPRRPSLNGSGPPSAPITLRSTTQPSPLFHAFSPADPSRRSSDLNPIERLHGRPSGFATAPNTPGMARVSGTRRMASGTFAQNFKFPAATGTVDQRSPEGSTLDKELTSSHISHNHSRLLSPLSREDVPTILEQAISSARVITPSSNAETPRSSGDFYSLSNNSTETLASEYLPQQSGTLQFRGQHTRRMSNLPTTIHSRQPETLMMGYAQLHGSFTLDGSLISQAPFEEVKKKGILGGQGGGVIGVETSKRDSGLLRGFGWGNIGESLGGLLSGGDLSSIRDMRETAGSKSIPLLSTPQSILFVDLRLAPGESRSFRYMSKLPRGLPPSHRGKAIKILYNLVIGTQRPGGAKEQQVKSVEVPFRILGSVNSHGELLGHDLMSPYIVLRDQARVEAVGGSPVTMVGSDHFKALKSAESAESTLEDFLVYVDDLLTRPRQSSSLGLLSPTDATRSHRASSIEEPTSAKEAIDMAILRSNLATDLQQSANRFEISRNGQRVAVVMLARPAYRLGETITAAIEFTDADIPCYALHASLETSEKVDPAIALRSDASIHRVTRKIYSSHSESTLFARRVVFSPTIPATATPTFITSGVSLEWKILIEFVTPRLEGGSNTAMRHNSELLEEISRDDRGVILAAAEAIDCERFEIAVPLRVYGALAGSMDRDESVDALVV